MANFLGTQGDDDLNGTPAGDKLYGYAGDDTLQGEAGNDSLYGGSGNNRLYGGLGSDYLWVGGETGSNSLYGNEGDDFLTGGRGPDILEGGEGNDRLVAGQGDDSLAGGQGNDSLEANDGNDILSSGGGIDLIYAGAGNDTLNITFTKTDDRRVSPEIESNALNGSTADSVTAYGEAGDDLLYGSPGNDLLDGGPGNDWLSGAAGDDTLISGGGIDTLIGGEGSDTYVVSNAAVTLLDSSGDDSITVGADWLKVPSSIETRNYGEAFARLPYWLDSSLADSAGHVLASVAPANIIHYGFPESAPAYLSATDSLERDPDALLGWQSFNSAQRQFTQDALAVFAGVANITFVESAHFDQLNMIVFATNRQSFTSGIFNAPSTLYSGSDVLINQLVVGSVSVQSAAVAAPQKNAYEASLWLRAIGGALGLKTPTQKSAIQASETASAPFLSDEIDIEKAFNQQLALYSPVVGQGSFPALSRMIDGAADLPGVEHDLSLGLLDIAALHYLYGPSPKARAGDDVYYLDAARSNFIWDGDGFDTLDASQSLQPVTLSLAPGFHGFMGEQAAESILAAGQQTVNFGTRIEKLVGSNLADTLTGNEFKNVIVGGGGSDKIAGGADIDTAVFTHARSSARVERSEDSWRVTANGETDFLTEIERLEFDDQALAIDLDGNAGDTAKLLGVLVGPAALSDYELVRVVLDIADTGIGYSAMLALGLDHLLGTSPSAEEVVNLIHNALTGEDASAELVADYGGRIDRGEMTAVSLAELAGENELNLSNINLVGLTDQGLVYSLG